MNIFKKAFRSLFPERTKIDFTGGYIPHRFFIERIKEGPVLVIGDYEGRDYPAILKKFPETYHLDVVDNGIAPKELYIEQTVTERIPKPDDYFKAILLTEVIEHVWEDKRALEELRRVLHPDGVLLLSVPFWNDFHDRHFHIYCPRTVDLLFKYSGYEILERNYRGLVVSLPYEFSAFLAILLYPFYRKHSLEKVNDLLYSLHMKLGNWRRLNSFFRFKYVFKRCGINVVAKKSDKVLDDIKVQGDYFKRPEEEVVLYKGEEKKTSTSENPVSNLQ